MWSKKRKKETASSRASDCRHAETIILLLKRNSLVISFFVCVCVYVKKIILQRRAPLGQKQLHFFSLHWFSMSDLCFVKWSRPRTHQTTIHWWWRMDNKNKSNLFNNLPLAKCSMQANKLKTYSSTEMNIWRKQMHLKNNKILIFL